MRKHIKQDGRTAEEYLQAILDGWTHYNTRSEFIDACYDNFYTSKYKPMKILNQRITCEDGFSVSVQANEGAYCYPRNDSGPYMEVELGFPHNWNRDDKKFLFPHMEYSYRPKNYSARWHRTMFGWPNVIFPYVDVDVVWELLRRHSPEYLLRNSWKLWMILGATLVLLTLIIGGMR
jgi:hypothetical protein